MKNSIKKELSDIIALAVHYRAKPLAGARAERYRNQFVNAVQWDIVSPSQCYRRWSASKNDFLREASKWLRADNGDITYIIAHSRSAITIGYAVREGAAIIMTPRNRYIISLPADYMANWSIYWPEWKRKDR